MRLIAKFSILLVLGVSACTWGYQPPQEISRSGSVAIFDNSYIAQIAEGRSNRDDVRTFFGMPTDVAFGPDGSEIWTYDTAITRSRGASVRFGTTYGGGSDTDARRLSVLFDPRGVVKRAVVAGTHTSIGPEVPGS
jgi:outer membrane protein assembly factor BamE (lipoprotein component of BamABCDE complex)